MTDDLATWLLDGRLIRSATDPHRHACQPPAQGQRGDIWQCSCLRRFTCIDHGTDHGTRREARANWKRRRWPWPRPDPNAEDLRETVRWEAEKRGPRTDLREKD